MSSCSVLLLVPAPGVAHLKLLWNVPACLCWPTNPMDSMIIRREDFVFRILGSKFYMGELSGDRYGHGHRAKGEAGRRAKEARKWAGERFPLCLSPLRENLRLFAQALEVLCWGEERHAGSGAGPVACPCWLHTVESRVLYPQQPGDALMSITSNVTALSSFSQMHFMTRNLVLWRNTFRIRTDVLNELPLGAVCTSPVAETLFHICPFRHFLHNLCAQSPWWPYSVCNRRHSPEASSLQTAWDPHAIQHEKTQGSYGS